MYLFNHAWSEGNIPKWVTPVAQQPVNTLKLNTRLPLSVFEKIPNTLFTTKPVLLENVLEDKRLDWETKVLFHEQMGAISTVIIPLLLGNQSFGFIQGNFGEDRKLSSPELHHLSLITNQVALAVQGMQLLEQTLARARREQLLREVTNRVNNAVGTDEILRQAAEQVGRALKRPVFIYLEDSPGKNLREI
jgi:GAF domain-containing protein